MNQKKAKLLRKQVGFKKTDTTYKVVTTKKSRRVYDLDFTNPKHPVLKYDEAGKPITKIVVSNRNTRIDEQKAAYSLAKKAYKGN